MRLYKENRIKKVEKRKKSKHVDHTKGLKAKTKTKLQLDGAYVSLLKHKRKK